MRIYDIETNNEILIDIFMEKKTLKKIRNSIYILKMGKTNHNNNNIDISNKV